jgi:hypothetical protein
MKRYTFSNLKQGLVGAWCPSVSGRGLVLPDLSGYNNHGTLTNMDSATDWVPSGSGLALDFDGVDDRVSLDSCASRFATLSTGALSLWFNVSSANPVQILFYLNETANPNNFFTLAVGNSTGTLADDSIGFGQQKNGVGVYFGFVRKGHTFYQDQKWHNVVVMSDSSSNSIYIDGIKQIADYPISGNASSSGFFNVFSVNSMSIGSRVLTGFPSNTTLGQIDDVRIYNRVLTPQEIQQLYTGGRGVGLAPERIKHRRKTSAAATNRRRRILIGASS